MRVVTVHRIELIEAVEANREKHRELFDKALEAYRKRGIEILEEHIDRIKKGHAEKVQVMLPVPEDHTQDYDRVLKMLTMSVDDNIEVTEPEFQCYVMDDWSWSRDFLTTASTYLEEV